MKIGIIAAMEQISASSGAIGNGLKKLFWQYLLPGRLGTRRLLVQSGVGKLCQPCLWLFGRSLALMPH
ncbi:MAG: hypothetical protein ACLR35_06260 [Streptococcus salivarius]